MEIEMSEIADPNVAIFFCLSEGRETCYIFLGHDAQQRAAESAAHMRANF